MGLFDQFPYTNFHELNMDWIIGVIKRLCDIYDGVTDKITEIVVQYLEQMLEDGELKELIDKILDEITKRIGIFPVSPEMYGAKGDGTTNDTLAFQNCLEYANSRNVDVKCEYGKTYLITPSQLTVQTSIDFSNSTLKPTSAGVMFKILPAETTNLTFNQDSLTRDHVTRPELFGKIFCITAPLILGTRVNTATQLPFVQTMQTDNRGYFIGNAYLPEVITGDYAYANIHSLEHRIEFKNLVVDFASASMGSIVEVRRSNVHVDNITLTNATGALSTYSLIFVSQCVSVEISNVRCVNVGKIDESGYVIGNYTSDYLYIHDCNFIDVSGQSWGSIGFSYAGNTVIERITTNRTDCHYCLTGDYVVRDSTLQYTDFCGGYGNFIFENIKFVSTTAQWVIDTRADLNNPLSGSIQVLNCQDFNSSGTFFRYNIRGACPVIDNLNYLDTTIIIKNLRGYAPNSNLVIEAGSLDADIAQTTSMYIDNVRGAYNRLNVNPVNDNTNQNKIKLLDIQNIEYTDLYSHHINVDTLRLHNLTLPSTILTLNADTTKNLQNNIIIVNSVFAGLTYVFLCNSFIICNNIIKGKRTFTHDANAKGFVANNYCSDDSTYQSNWNAGLVN